MSTGTKRSAAEAQCVANEFRRLFTGTHGPSYDKWEFAGSLRRGKAEVGDIEHVVVSRRDERTLEGFFLPQDTDLVLYDLDGLVDEGRVAKAIYSDGKHRWGERYRGVVFLGFKQEVFLAHPDSFGSMLVIRTGPWEFSQRMVTQLRQRGWCHERGRVRYASGPNQGQPVACRTEREFFEMCGEPWTEPEDRA